MNIFKIVISIIIMSFAINSYTQDDLVNADIKTLTLKKTEDLGHYITTIGNKEFEREYREEAVHSAINLFTSDKSIVQVSSLRKGKPMREFNIRKYLNKLMVLPYAKVEITWFDIELVTDFKKGSDGKLYAVVRIYQKFTGYNAEGQPLYTDYTTKNISVSLTRIKIPTDNGMENEYQVLLGDIKVIETK